MIALFALLAWFTSADIQPSRVTLSGSVVDGSGGVLPGAEVSLVASGVAVATAFADAAGAFELTAPAGVYTLRVTLDGFAAFETGVTLRDGERGPPVKAELAVASFADTVVVTGSRTPEALRTSPVAITVLRAPVIETTAAGNFADLLRGVPGVNAIELSARDVQITTRTAAGRAARTTLALLDGRSVYQDYFGMVLWDLMPVGFDEIKQVEVLRGPGSALWGANALTGVVNVLTRSPREMLGTRGHIGFGERGSREAGVVHAGANGRVAYKLSASYRGQDHWDRPEALPDGTPLPNYTSKGTDQFKADARVEIDGANGGRWRVDGGMASSSGLMLVAVGPYDARPLRQGYGSVEYARGTTSISAAVTAHTARYKGLLAPATTSIDSQSVQVDARRSTQAGARHLLTFGGTVKGSHFDLNFVPDLHSRAELGAFVADDIFLSDRVRLAGGVRLDWFDTFGAFASPRVGVRYEPAPGHTIRATYNRAYVAPSVVENGMYFQSSTILPLPTGNFTLPILSLGDLDLDPQTIDAIEAGYTGAINPRLTLSASLFRNHTQGLIQLLVSRLYSPQDPPPGWPLPPAALAALPLPKTLTWTRIGSLREWGAELSLDASIARGVTATGSYSYQADPELRGDNGAPAPFVVNRPARHRGSVSVSVSRGRALGSFAINGTSRAFWTDVLAYTGYTDAFAQVNAMAGVRFRDGRFTALVRGTNLTNGRVQQHLFGDIIGRRVVAELRFAFQEGS